MNATIIGVITIGARGSTKMFHPVNLLKEIEHNTNPNIEIIIPYIMTQNNCQNFLYLD